MITTIDNPYDPFDQWEEWYNYDLKKGYHTCEYLDRVSYTSFGMSDEQNHREIERAIDEIIEKNPVKLWKKVVKEVEEPPYDYCEV